MSRTRTDREKDQIRQSTIEQVCGLIEREEMNFIFALRDQLERRALTQPAFIDRAAIEEEVADGLESSEFIDFDRIRAGQQLMVGPDMEIVRLAVQIEDDGLVHNIIERNIVGHVGLARALATAAATLAASFTPRYAEFEES